MPNSSATSQVIADSRYCYSSYQNRELLPIILGKQRKTFDSQKCNIHTIGSACAETTFVAFQKIDGYFYLDLQQGKRLLSSGSQQEAKAHNWFLQRALLGADEELLSVFASELWSRKVWTQRRKRTLSIGKKYK